MTENAQTQDSVPSSQTQEAIDYSEESERLSNGGSERNLITLPEGINEVEFTGEGQVETFNYGTEDQPDLQEKVVYPVSIVGGPDEGAEGHYAVTRASTDSSQWGQLVSVAQDRDGLEGETVTIIRNGQGTDTSYTVQEAAELKEEE